MRAEAKKKNRGERKMRSWRGGEASATKAKRKERRGEEKEEEGRRHRVALFVRGHWKKSLTKWEQATSAFTPLIALIWCVLSKLSSSSAHLLPWSLSFSAVLSHPVPMSSLLYTSVVSPLVVDQELCLPYTYTCWIFLMLCSWNNMSAVSANLRQLSGGRVRKIIALLWYLH